MRGCAQGGPAAEDPGKGAGKGDLLMGGGLARLQRLACLAVGDGKPGQSLAPPILQPGIWLVCLARGQQSSHAVLRCGSEST